MIRNGTKYLRRRIVLLIGAVCVVVLGNMRPMTLQAATRNHVAQPALPQGVGAGAHEDSLTTMLRIAELFSFERTSVDRVSEQIESASPSADDGQLIPAIYAWDPDVRFVYYRHISKWM